jgi:hypothetical protein
MKSANILKIWLYILPILFLTTNVLANELDSTNFKLIGVTTTGGGGITESTSYKMLSTVGQISSSPRNYSTNYRLDQDPSAIFRAAQPSIGCFETTTDGYSECITGPQDLIDGGMVTLCGLGGCYDKARFEISHSPYLYSTSLDGLIGYWPLDEPSGTGAYIKDRSGKNNNGTPTGTTFVDGISRGARSFNGTNQYISVPFENYDEISISVWFYRNSKDTVNADSIFGGWYWTSNASLRQGFDIRFYINSDTIQFPMETKDSLGNVTEFSPSYNLGSASVGNWYHVAGTYQVSTGQHKLYVNGVLRSTSNHPAGNTIVPLTYYSDRRIGYSRVNNGYFDGTIDELLIFNRTLSLSEVQSLYSKDNDTYNPPDTLYGIQISTDNFVSDIRCIDGSTFRPKSESNCEINDFRTEEYWEDETFNIKGLDPNTQYYIRISALHGDFTQSDFSSVRDATTSEGYMFFDIDIATTSGEGSESSPPYSITFSGSETLVVGAPAQTASSLIWLDAESSSSGGIAIIQFGSNGGLYSPTTSETLPSTNQNLNTTNAEGFGLQSYYINYLSSSYLGSITPTTNYSSSGNTVGEVSTTAKKIYDGDGPINEGRMGIYLKARAGNSRTPASDYSETISFILVPRY